MKPKKVLALVILSPFFLLILIASLPFIALYILLIPIFWACYEVLEL